MRRLDANPRQWKLVKLLEVARQTAGSPELRIVTDELYNRGLLLNGLRQRIHAGCLLGEHPAGPIPDIRPEEVREARHTSEQIVRAILDWLARVAEGA